MPPRSITRPRIMRKTTRRTLRIPKTYSTSPKTNHTVSSQNFEMQETGEDCVCGYSRRTKATPTRTVRIINTIIQTAGVMSVQNSKSTQMAVISDGILRRLP